MTQQQAIERLAKWLEPGTKTGAVFVRHEYLRMLSEQTAALAKEWSPEAYIVTDAKDITHAIIEALEV